MVKEALPEGQRRCIGSERYGITAHVTETGEFPLQPSQPGGIGRMCKTHWNQYTAGLARDRKAANGDAPKAPRAAKAPKPEKISVKRERKAKTEMPAELPATLEAEASDEGQATLAQAAQAARERRRAVGRPVEEAVEA